MDRINASELGYKELNEAIRAAGTNCTVNGCCGQRFIAAGMSDKNITINGTPGNALGAYLNGANIKVHGNAQDAVGDTMNGGSISIHGNAGDAVGYAMRGGEIYIKGNAGYRAGIHMKQYETHRPVMVIGGCTGSFMGEYQAGGLIIVLGLGKGSRPIVSNFPCTGMHGGKMVLRGDVSKIVFPAQVTVSRADEQTMKEIVPFIKKFCRQFEYVYDEVMSEEFYLVSPDSKNPYKQMYVAN